MMRIPLVPLREFTEELQSYKGIENNGNTPVNSKYVNRNQMKPKRAKIVKEES